ncbi:MAG: hypothetical protein J5672_00665 [Verrucomicrobia bacterium]|nr:hypothetical protein [Verrucomicrobiota bacterium]
MSETIENTLESGKRKKFSFAVLIKRILIILGILVFIGAIYYVGSYCVWKSRLRLNIEEGKIESELLDTYLTGTLDECIEKLQNGICYYETNRLKFETPHYRVVADLYNSNHERIGCDIGLRVVDVDSRICFLRYMLGYCFLCAGEPVRAYTNILPYYEYCLKEFPKTPLAHTRSQVMQRVIDTFERQCGVPNWKADHPIDTNVFRMVDDMFRTNAPVTEEFFREKELKKDNSNE